ncbi:MAG TPA: PD-(D/E)XK nuclease family protein [Nitrospiraceae bacterium]
MSLPSRADTFMDNTKVSAYKDCPRKYFYRHVMHWRGEGVAAPLLFGGAWHSAMDVVWKELPNKPLEEVALNAVDAFAVKWEAESGMSAQLDFDQQTALAPRTPMIAAEMLSHYVYQRQKMILSCELIAAEQPFAVPMPNIDHGWYVGRLDKAIRWQGETIVIEHKTTALYRKDGPFQYDWLEGWHMDAQVKGYEFGGMMYHPEKFGGIWVDGALVHKTIHDGFKFIPVKHGMDLVKEWLADTQQWVERINQDTISFQNDGHLVRGTFPKNENHCFGKYGRCPYVDLCRTKADVFAGEDVPFGYMVEAWEPFETLGLSKIIHEGA